MEQTLGLEKNSTVSRGMRPIVSALLTRVESTLRWNLFRMRQFHEAYRGQERLSPLVRQLPWTHTPSDFTPARNCDMAFLFSSPP